MNPPGNFRNSPMHQALLDEYQELDSDETRLEWLMERQPLHSALPEEALNPNRRVPGCLSGLWLHSKLENGKSKFSSHSDSAMVQGISSFLCDLHSERSPQELLQIGQQLAKQLGLERLLSMNRKRAVISVMNYILAEARRHLEILDPSPTSEAV